MQKQIKEISYKTFLIFLCFLQIWIPTALFSWSPYDILKFIDFKPAKIALNYFSGPNMAFAQQMDFNEAAAQGQAFGQGLIPSDPSSLGSADESGITINWGNQTSNISVYQLFPDMNNTSDPNPEDTFGSDGGTISLANSQVEEMNASESYTGEAFRTLGTAVDRAHVDISSDPWWSLTDQTFDDIFNSTFSNCTVSEVVTCSNSTAHVPDYRICERVQQFPNGCTCYHDYTVEIVDTFSVDMRITYQTCTTCYSDWSYRGIYLTISDCSIAGFYNDNNVVIDFINEVATGSGDIDILVDGLNLPADDYCTYIYGPDNYS